MPAQKVRQTQAERRGEAERRILEATIRLISKQGFSKLTLSDVGEEAGYSRGLPAHYFGKKESLLLAVATHILGQFLDYAGRLTDRSKSEFDEIFRVYAHAARRNPSFARATVMIYSEALINEALAAELKPLIRARLQAIAEILARAVERGEIKPIEDLQVEAAKILALLRGVLSLSAVDPEFPIENVLNSYYNSLRNVASPASGLANAKQA